MLAIETREGFARIRCTDKDAYTHALETLFEAENGTTGTFTVLNNYLESRRMKKVVSYSRSSRGRRVVEIFLRLFRGVVAAS